MKHPKNNNPLIQPTRPSTPVAATSLLRWVVLAVGLFVSAGASWAFMEFVVWNKLPGALVGKWEVVQGPPEYEEAGFEFHRSGTLVGHLNDNGRLRIMHAEVRVDDDKLHITTRQPSTGKQHVSVQTIRTLDARELVLVDEQGRIMKMTRFR